MLQGEVGKRGNVEQRSLSGGSKFIEQTLLGWRWKTFPLPDAYRVELLQTFTKEPGLPCCFYLSDLTHDDIQQLNAN